MFNSVNIRTQNGFIESISDGTFNILNFNPISTEPSISITPENMRKLYGFLIFSGDIEI